MWVEGVVPAKKNTEAWKNTQTPHSRDEAEMLTQKPLYCEADVLNTRPPCSQVHNYV